MPFEGFGQIVIAEAMIGRECREQIVVQRRETLEVEVMRRGILRARIGRLIRLRDERAMVPTLIEDVDLVSQRSFLRLKIPRLTLLF